MAVVTSKANRDEECDQCGYPFDEGDRCWLQQELGIVYCSLTCVRKDQRWIDANKERSETSTD